jgi:hypothetical protein
MITILGKTVVVKPLTATQIGEVLDSVLKLGACTPTIRFMEPDMWPHLLRVIAASIRSEFPGATVDQLAEELKEALPCEYEVLSPILQSLSRTEDPSKGRFVVKGVGHERLC